jgi:hypothetical protein
MKNEKRKTEAVSAGQLFNRLRRDFRDSAAGVIKIARRAQIPFLIFSFSFLIFNLLFSPRLQATNDTLI